MSVLKYNAYAFSPTPKLTVEREPLGNADGAQQAYRETWTLRGELLGAQASLKTQVEALEAALAANGGDLTLYADDVVTVLRQLLNSGCAGGTHIVKAPNFAEMSGAVFATYLPYEIGVAGVVTAADAPGANAWGEKSTVTITESDGTVRKRVSGSYKGSGAQAAADAAKLAVDVLVVSEEQTVAVADGSVSFAYEYIDTAESRGILAWQESVGLTIGSSEKVWRYALGGTVPTRQTTVVRESRGSQEGSAVGLTDYPDFPDPVWAAADYADDPKKQKGTPERLADGSWRYPINWSYQFAWDSAPSFPDPTPPPS